MFQPKHLYTVIDNYWFVFPTKDSVEEFSSDKTTALGVWVAGSPRVAARVARDAEFWSQDVGCLVTFIQPGSNFMVVEVDGKFVHIIGDRVGWIVADMKRTWIKESFEEITTP